MKILPKRGQLAQNPNIAYAFIEKMAHKFDFGDGELSHAEIQACLDVGVRIDYLRAYSPVLTKAQTEAEVPANWPGAYATDKDGNPYRKKYHEYTKRHEVEGGYVLRFTGADMNENRRVTNPTWEEFKVWVSRVGGFMTEQEFRAIRVAKVVEE